MPDIKGYRNLTPDELSLINEIKESAEKLGSLVDRVDAAQFALVTDGNATLVGVTDQRWVAIARTQLQQGFMALTRAIAKPTTF